MTCTHCNVLRVKVRVIDAEAATLRRRAATFDRLAAQTRAQLAEHQRAHAYGLTDPAMLGSWDAEAARQGAR